MVFGIKPKCKIEGKIIIISLEPGNTIQKNNPINLYENKIRWLNYPPGKCTIDGENCFSQFENINL